MIPEALNQKNLRTANAFRQAAGCAAHQPAVEVCHSVPGVSEGFDMHTAPAMTHAARPIAAIDYIRATDAIKTLLNSEQNCSCI
eukprot:scaffold187282_cov34-Prasinocladus_malaysianus.AAC.1